jgi:hypothetical protein
MICSDECAHRGDATDNGGKALATKVGLKIRTDPEMRVRIYDAWQHVFAAHIDQLFCRKYAVGQRSDFSAFDIEISGDDASLWDDHFAANERNIRWGELMKTPAGDGHGRRLRRSAPLQITAIDVLFHLNLPAFRVCRGRKSSAAQIFQTGLKRFYQHTTSVLYTIPSMPARVARARAAYSGRR